MVSPEDGRPTGELPMKTAQPCVTAPAGERGDAQMRQSEPRGSVSSMAVPGRRGPLAFHRKWVEQAPVPVQVNQDLAGTHLPATAWPRQMRPPRADQLWSGSPDGS